MKMLLKRRSKTHKSEKYQCQRPWEIDVSNAVGPQVPMVEHQIKHLRLNPSTLFVSDDKDDGETTKNTASLSTGGDSATPVSATTPGVRDEESSDDNDTEYLDTSNSNT